MSDIGFAVIGSVAFLDNALRRTTVNSEYVVRPFPFYNPQLAGFDITSAKVNILTKACNATQKGRGNSQLFVRVVFACKS